MKQVCYGFFSPLCRHCELYYPGCVLPVLQAFISLQNWFQLIDYPGIYGNQPMVALNLCSSGLQTVVKMTKVS